MYRRAELFIEDYVVLVGMLLLALLIGFYYAYKDRKKSTTENYYFGDSNLSPIPVGLSMALTFVSSITVLAYPAHAYLYGTVIMWFGISTLVQALIACLYYIPLLHRLKIKSINQYLEMRFNGRMKVLNSFILVVNMVFYMAITVFLTGLCLDAVSPIKLNVGIIVTSATCTLYTTLGGMKAVIWTDTFQAFVLLAGSLAVFIKGILMVGGIGNVQEAIVRGERNTFWEFDLDPTIPHSFWTIFIGGAFAWCGTMCTNQAITQRYLSCKSVKDARVASLTSAIPICFLLILAALNGCVIYAYYEGCDPVLSKRIRLPDQLTSLMVLDIFHDIPGMAGLFISSAYSGMLSTVSSGINSMAVLILEDFILPCKPHLTQSIRLKLSKFVSFLLGSLTAGIAFVVPFLGSTVIKIIFSFVGIFVGSMTAVFTMGIFFPWANTVGAFAGLLSGPSVAFWVFIGSVMQSPSSKVIHSMPPRSIEMCPIIPGSPHLNVSTSSLEEHSYVYSTSVVTTWSAYNMAALSPTTSHGTFDYLYSISYMYLGVLGFLVSLFVGLLVSFITGPSNPKSMDPVLFLPLVDNEHLPEKIRKFFRFGVPDIPPHSRSISKSLNGSHKFNQDEKKLPETLLLVKVEELESVV
ncbi:unnamed protein product [Clavelina lepadiformis]|uniref:Sodium-coupled monocarboxylate transporter 1 n=2 Tax=Clavelina lepadiformis TaxID=159417 RepID=A0ABP0FW89_CLALP